MENTVKILRLLMENSQARFSIRKISESLKMNYRIAHEKVLQLEKEGLVKLTPIGNTRLCEITSKFSSRVFEAEYGRAKDAMKNKDILIITKALSELEFPFIALLFGSHASNTHNRHSDIDILTIGGDRKKIEECVSLLPDRIHLTPVTYAEFSHMAKSREFSVVGEALKNNVILLGIEDFYRLLENAKRA